jgi:alkylated DNA repair dioxygenase AlkB
VDVHRDFSFPSYPGRPQNIIVLKGYDWLQCAGISLVIQVVMQGLFPDIGIFPEGFLYVPGFLSANEENTLVDEIRRIELHTFHFRGFAAKRRVASFGYNYSFEKNNLAAGKPMPEVFLPLIEKVAARLSLPARDFGELLTTEYPPGAVINWHRDAFPFDVIAGISLLADCSFRLRPHDKLKQVRSAVISIPLARRSLYVLQGPARRDWQHSISPVKTTRYSITLRTLRQLH